MPFAISPPPLSPTDRSLLSALFDPASDLPATAAPLGLDLLDLAHWLAQPHIQAQLELIESLRALRREVWAEQLRHEAAEALREALRETGTSDPAERRRCANTLLRATSTPRTPRGKAQSPGLQPGLSGVRPLSAPHADSTAPRTTAPTPAEAGGSESVNAPPHSTPHTSHPSLSLSTESLLSQALATLRACGYDVSDDDLDDLDDAELDARDDAELDAIDDAELDEFAANLTDADPPRRAKALSLADQYLADPHDTS